MNSSPNSSHGKSFLLLAWIVWIVLFSQKLTQPHDSKNNLHHFNGKMTGEPHKKKSPTFH